MTRRSEPAQGFRSDRRAFGLGAGALIGAGAVSPTSLNASPPREGTANAATYAFSVGAIRATVVSDGQIAFPAWPSYAPDVEASVVAAAMRKRRLTPPDYRLDANALLLEIDGARILVDTGWGAFAPPVGALTANLRGIGVEPDAIDLVILSHIHPDHAGGLRTAAGEKAFANADIIVSVAELEQWRAPMDLGAMSIDDSFKPVFAEAAKAVFDRGARLIGVAPGEEIAPGLSLFTLPGHTAGHCGVRITSGDQELLYAADCFHEQAFDLDHPDWRTVFDYDPGQAAQTRRALLDRAAAEGALLMAFHMPFPGVGHVDAASEGYLWRPTPWVLSPTL